LLAIFEFNAGGALDNAKKLVEISGKKGTDLHAATVIGDTFGDPLKDTAGPSLHILIKLSNILSITMIPLFLFVEDLSLVMRFGIAGAVVLIWIIISLIVKYIRKKL
ncbi:MAG: sodium/proton-translocating pyrophosphatase, partial [Candidatus Njordarchaeota archaeon]